MKVGLKVGESLVSISSFAPVRTGISEDASVLNGSKGKVDGGRFRDNICNARGGRKLACGGDARENRFNSIIGIPFGGDVVTVLFQYFRSDVTVRSNEMSNQVCGGHSSITQDMVLKCRDIAVIDGGQNLLLERNDYTVVRREALQSLVVITVGLRDLDGSGVGWCRSLNARMNGNVIGNGSLKSIVFGDWHDGT